MGKTNGSNAVLQLSGGTIYATSGTAGGVGVGSTSGANGSIQISSGTFTTSGDGEIYLGGSDGGGSNGGYGALTMTGGMLNVASWLCVNRGGNGVLNVSGGTLNNTGNNLTIGTVPAGGYNAVVNFSSSAIVNISGNVYLPEQQSSQFSVLNMSGRTWWAIPPCRNADRKTWHRTGPAAGRRRQTN